VRRPLLLAVPLLVLIAGCSPDPSPSSTKAGPSGSASAAPAGPDYTVWAAGRSTPVADPLYPAYGHAGVDVLHYGLELEWAPDTRTLTGQATVRLRAAADLTAVKLDFSQAYTIDGATLNGAAVTATIADNDLTVPGAVAKDAFATLVVKYHGTPKTVPMPSNRSDSEPLGLTVAADGGLWTMQEPYGASTWYPSNDQPSDKALYDIAVTVPAGWSAVATGAAKPQEGGTFRYAATDPVATYLTTLAVGRYTKETAEGPRGVPLTYWYRKGTDDKLLPVIKKSPQLLGWLEQRFGPYPFASGGVVMVPSGSAMETQQMVTMGTPDYGTTKTAEIARYFEDDLLHEYAHHWFGNTVGPTNWKDLWLNEGWATYVQHLYANQRDKVTAKAWEEWARGVDARLRGRLGPPGNPRAENFAESNVYMCPALMLHQIHKQLGDDAFFALAREWAQQHRNTTQDRASFIAFVNKQTGKDFTSLINAWLDSPTTPK
jgi:aminopeptidase N